MNTGIPEVLGSKARYKLQTILARGGMAEIWLARQEGAPDMSKYVVVKRILPRLAKDKDFREMFADEARITSRFDHPNIVRIHETNLEGDDLFLVLEYLEGESLAFVVSAAMEKGREMPPTLIAGIMAQVCDALEYVHKLRGKDGKPLQIVHRDISPQNIIVLYSGQVKLVDFGVAKAEKKIHQTQTGMLKGKVFYLSPEECLGEKVDARSDIFSLGVIFWEMLTRRHLFKRKLDIETLRAIVSSRIPPVRTFNQEVSVGLDAVVLRALERSSADRYPSASDMGMAIREHLRRTKTMAGGSEIRSFYLSVLADRMDTKRKLLKKLEESDDKPAFVSALKPDTEKMLPLAARPDQLKGLADADDVEESTEVSGLSQRPPENITAAPRAEKPLLTSEPEGPGDTTEVTETTAPDTSLMSSQAATLPPPGEIAPRPRTGLSGFVLDWDKMPRAVEYSLPVLAGLILAFVLVAFLVRRPADQSEPRQSAQASIEHAPTMDPQPATDPEEKTVELAEAMLSIRSRPSGCQVRLNGVRLPGRTPVQNVSVEANQEYEVSLLCRKHKQESKRVRPKSGERLELSFNPPRSRSSSQTGQLDLNTSPWTEVYLGSRKLGLTPLLGYKLSAGKHQLRAVNKKYGIDVTLTVTITAGKTTRFFKNLEK